MAKTRKQAMSFGPSVTVVGIHGANNAGKDTVADYLVEAYGFKKLSMAIGLYEYTARALGMPGVDALLAAKDALAQVTVPNPALSEGAFGDTVHAGRLYSIRELLRIAGDHVRSHDKYAWIKQFDKKLHAIITEARLSGHSRVAVVVPSVRTQVEGDLEREYLYQLRDAGARVELWHVWRDSTPPQDGPHITDTVFRLQTGDKLIINNGSVDELGTGVTLLLQGNGIVNIAEGRP